MTHEAVLDVPAEYQDLAHYITQMRVPPYAHQLVGIRRLLDKPVFALFDEPGAGKTKQIIDAAQILFFNNIIDVVIVIAPASVRGVWTDQRLGELRKHLWNNTPATVSEYHQKVRRWRHGPDAARSEITGKERRLNFIVTNYDFIRNPNRLKRLFEATGRRTWLVLDESSAIKGHKAQQTQACRTLRQRCARVTLLNGTPIENGPGDMFSQSYMMHPSILNCPTWLHFRSRYAIVTAHRKGFDQIVGWQNLEDLRERLKPYVLRRLKKDCLDLPPRLPAVIIPVPLDPITWRLYKQMRDELVAWLSDQSVSISIQAGVKIMRLAQLCSGFIGGVVELDNDEFELPESDVATKDRPSWLPYEHQAIKIEKMEVPKYANIAASELRDIQGIAQVGREKVNTFIDLMERRLEQDPYQKIIGWCRFRVELYRLKAELERHPLAVNGKMLVHAIHGAQKRDSREEALRAMHPETAPRDIAVVTLGTLGTGARGHNLTASYTMVNMSHDFRYGTYLQAQERIDRPGQTHNIEPFDFVATGPEGQRTVDHTLLAARERKENLAQWTTAAWVSELQREE
jgi:SNF2 family DNA or RNA helicase